MWIAWNPCPCDHLCVYGCVCLCAGMEARDWYQVSSSYQIWCIFLSHHPRPSNFFSQGSLVELVAHWLEPVSSNLSCRWVTDACASLHPALCVDAGIKTEVTMAGTLTTEPFPQHLYSINKGNKGWREKNCRLRSVKKLQGAVGQGTGILSS